MENIYQRRLDIACRRLANHVRVTGMSDTLESVLKFMGTLTHDSVPYDNHEMLEAMYADLGYPRLDDYTDKDLAAALCQAFLQDLWEFHQTGLREFHNVTMVRPPTNWK